jgi:hypothetical protein
MLAYSLAPGPLTLQGAQFVAVSGTSVNFTAGLPVAYTGFALSNPPTVSGQVPKKLTVLRVSFCQVGTATATGNCPVGLIKFTTGGTASVGSASTVAGVIFPVGAAGTASSNIGTLAGTFTLLNGTAGPANVNALNWVQLFLDVAAGTFAAPATGLYELQGEVTIMPGETVAIAPVAALSAMAGFHWVEIPLNSGA